MNKRALYFGCEDPRYAGHGLHSDGNEQETIYPKSTYPGFPWNAGHLDGGLLTNGKVKDTPTGKVYWTHGGKTDLWYAFYWWDRTGDSRPGSNSGLYVLGFDVRQEKEAFEYGCSKWPKIIGRQKHSLELITREHQHV